MIKGKKGDQTTFIVTLVFLLGLTILAYLLVDKSSKFDSISKGKTIGERQFELFTGYAEGEKALFYADESSKIAIEKASEDLAKNGGQASSACGKYNGYSLWKNGENECIPDSEEAAKNYYKLLTRAINQYYMNYQDAELPAEYSYSISDGNLIGTAKKEITITKGQKDTFSYKSRPSFKQKFTQDFSIYDDISKKATQIIESCEANENFQECANGFNGQEAGNAKLDVGCGQQTEKGKPVKICAEIYGKTYRFALSNDPIETTGNEIETIKLMAEKHDVPLEMALKIAAVESGFSFSHYDEYGNAKKGDGGCSIGLMQINTCAHKQCKGTITYNPNSKDICTGTESCSGTTIEDLHCNIEAGIMYLKKGYSEYETQQTQGKIESSECYSCYGKYTKWDYAFRFYNGCKCKNNNYVEMAKKADVTEYLIMQDVSN